MISLVCTTINPFAEYLIENIKKFTLSDRSSFIILDRKVSDEFQGKEFISFNDKPLNNYSKLCLFDTYARKNLGFIEAFKSGLDVFETDDDNLITIEIKDLENYLLNTKCECVTGKQANLFSEIYEPNGNFFWARGLPLSLRNTKTSLTKCGKKKIGVYQFLVNGNPDLDAIYRMVVPSSDNFNVKHDFKGIRLYNFYHPFNSQGTLWRKEFLNLAYLPTFCNFRMTDIWRGYIAQNILYKHDIGISFERPALFQKRNPHDIYDDFMGEYKGYSEIFDVLEVIASVNYGSIREMLFQSYEKLIKLKIITDKRELILLDAYLDNFN